MDLFGSGYVIDHCIAALNEKNEDNLLKIYITDRIKELVESVCGIGGVKYDAPRWIEWFDRKEEKPQRTSAEIISGIKDKLRQYGGEIDGIDAV